MRTQKAKAITSQISNKYGMQGQFVFTKLDRNTLEIRTELPSYEGGLELQEKLEESYPNYIAENQGGCVYLLYRPK